MKANPYKKPLMMSRKLFKINLNIYIIIVFSGMGLLVSCDKDIKPETSASPLRYYPLGNDIEPRILSNFNQGQITAIVNGSILTQRGADLSRKGWELPLNGWPLALIPCKDKSSIVLKNDPFWGESLNFCRVSENGEYIFCNDNVEYFPEYPNYTEHLISVTSDENNGIYVIVGLLENGKWAENILSKDIFLLHFNSLNKVDQKFSLNEYFVNIACDNSGKLYGLYYSKNTWGATGTGAADSVITVAFNEAALQSNKFIPDWKRTKSHTEYYTNFYFERFTFLSVNSNTVYMALPKAKWLDVVYGFDLYAFNKTDGNMNHTLSHTAKTEANTYSEGALYHMFSNENGCYVSYRIGASTKLVHMNNSGQNDLNIDLKGKSNRTDVMGIHQLQNSVGIFGISTFGNSLTYKPFVYEISE